MKKLLVILALMFSGVATQAINTWTGAVDGDFNTAGNWSDGGAPVSTFRANDDAFFDATAANFSPAFSVDSNPRHLILNGGNYTLGGPGILTFNSGVCYQWGSGAFGISAPIYQGGGAFLQFVGTGSGAITLSGGVDLTFANAGSQIQKASQGELILNSAINLRTAGGGNMLLRAGRTTFSGSGALNDTTGTIMLGAIGVYGNSHAIDTSGAELLIDDTGTAIANRLGTQRAVQFGSRSLLEFRGNAAASSLQASSNNMDMAVTVTLQNSGPGERIRISNGPGQAAHLAFNALKLNGGNNNQDQNGIPALMTMLVPSGSTLGVPGAAGGRLIFTNAPLLDNGLLRYFVVRDEASGNVDFATYNAAIDSGAQLGVQASTTYARTNDIRGAGATENILQIGSYTTVFTNSPACNALKIVATNALGSIELGTNQFWIKNAAGLIFQGGYDYAINGTTNLYFGTGAGASSYAYIATNTLTINTRVVREGEFNKAGDGLLVFAGPVFSMSSDRRMAVDKGAGSGDDLQISSPISGTGRFVKDGAGTLALTGSGDNSGLIGNTSGGAGLYSGTLVLAKDTQDLQNKALGTNFINFNTPGGGTLAARGFPYSVANNLQLAYQGSPASYSRFAGDQPITFSGLVYGPLNSGQNHPIVNDTTAPLAFSGTVQGFGTNNASTVTATLEFSGSGNTVVSGVIRNGDPAWANIATMATAVTKGGPGRLTLSGANTYSGQTTVNAGFLRLDSVGALGANSLRICQTPDYAGEDGYPVVELGAGNTSFTRQIGPSGTAGRVNIGHTAFQNICNAGFASVSGTATVNLGVAGVGGSSELLVWGAGNFFSASTSTGTGGLILGSPGCAGTLDFQNPIELSYRTRTFIALDGTANVDGKLSGVISSVTNGSSGIIKLGAGTLELSAGNTYTGTTAINAGRLLVSGSLASTNVVVASGGTLAGTGTLAGPVTVLDGGTLSAGASIGTLVINNSLSLSNSSSTVVEINASTGARDLVTGLSSVTYGGTLIVTTNYAGTVTNNQTFQIFSATTPTGNFSTISNQVAGVSSWTFNPASGVLTAMVSAVAPTPTNITYTVTGASPNQQLVLNWPAGQGWQLQAQTNTLATGLTTNWFDVSGAVPPHTNAISPASPAVFYRLKY